MRRLFIASVLAIGLAAPVLAHHSPAAFEASKTITLVGTVKEFRWQNPHSWIEMMFPNEKGQDVLWAVELTSPTYLVKSGWKSNTLKQCDKVTVVGRPLKTGEVGSAIFMSVTLADGRKLTESPARLGGSPRPAPAPTP